MSKIERIVSLGCIVCRNDLDTFTPAEFHHIHSDAHRRIGPEVGIALCGHHHREGTNGPEYVSRHPWKREFEARYGTEWELYEQTLRLLDEKNS